MMHKSSTHRVWCVCGGGDIVVGVVDILIVCPVCSFFFIRLFVVVFVWLPTFGANNYHYHHYRKKWAKSKKKLPHTISWTTCACVVSQSVIISKFLLIFSRYFPVNECINVLYIFFLYGPFFFSWNFHSIFFHLFLLHNFAMFFCCCYLEFFSPSNKIDINNNNNDNNNIWTMRM